MRVLACGSDAVLIEVDSAEQVQHLHGALRAAPPGGVTELVPAARTVLVRYDPRTTDPHRLRTALTAFAEPPRTAALPPAGTTETVRIPVRYDGPDLAEVAARTGLTERQVVERHTAAHYRVAFCGFAPGFAYLTGLDPQLRLPRRTEPRTRVPAGTVAVADEYTGIYPSPSPGGWHLLGTTALTLWDPAADPPTRLRPGTAVRFVEAQEHPGADHDPR
ncbi:5-oxoprolinase subunit B family protein [Kitasatospora griseola]|uniref:5-oxoprolinase subunit B family protein n=1 Tax=Kitasatospora griseola TaxID=2064 RepID=UPI0016711584|nr:allophanate hydrolase subunit 1 [Kitasatospora griseola]GGQ96295.1 allophanate hydrolase [Kitasatospora griseola]